MKSFQLLCLMLVLAFVTSITLPSVQDHQAIQDVPTHDEIQNGEGVLAHEEFAIDPENVNHQEATGVAHELSYPVLAGSSYESGALTVVIKDHYSYKTLANRRFRLLYFKCSRAKSCKARGNRLPCCPCNVPGVVQSTGVFSLDNALKEKFNTELATARRCFTSKVLKCLRCQEACSVIRLVAEKRNVMQNPQLCSTCKLASYQYSQCGFA